MYELTQCAAQSTATQFCMMPEQICIHTEQNYNLRFALKTREIFEELCLEHTSKGLVTACAQLNAQLLFLAWDRRQLEHCKQKLFCM